MKIVVTVPWRASPGRERWLEVVRKHYAVHFPEATLITEDSDPSKPFNRSQARNNCVIAAKKRNADVVIINDADTLARSTALREAVNGAYADGRLHLPFTTVQVYSGYSAEAFAANPAFPVAGGFESTGGIYVCRPDAWERFTGADENFRGWGGEDDAIYAAATVTCGVVRHIGVGISLGHTEQRLVNPHYAQNMLRAKVYQNLAASGERDMPTEALKLWRYMMMENMDKLDKLDAARVLVVVPSRGRPDNVQRLIDTVKATKFCDTDVIVGLDQDDAANYSDVITRNSDTTFVVRPRQRLNAWWNQLAAEYLDVYDYMLFAGDDNVFVTNGWDWLLVNELRKHNNAGFATGPDLLRTDKNFTWAMISTEQLRHVGYVGPEGLTHLCIDTAWQYVARETKSMWWNDAAVIEHLHYARQDVQVEKDQTYADANSSEMYRVDHEVVARWASSPEFQRYCNIVTDMLKGHPVEQRPAAPPDDYIEINFRGNQVFAGTIHELIQRLA